MHKAPTVDYPVGRSRFQAVALAPIWLSVFGAHALWLATAERLDWRHGSGLAVVIVAAAVALCAWRATPSGTLRWDGQSWWRDSAGSKTSGEIAPYLDMQHTFLLGFTEHSGAFHWLWLEYRAAPTRWSALRRAVHAPRRADASAGIEDAKLGVGAALAGREGQP